MGVRAHVSFVGVAGGPYGGLVYTAADSTKESAPGQGEPSFLQRIVFIFFPGGQCGGTMTWLTFAAISMKAMRCLPWKTPVASPKEVNH